MSKGGATVAALSRQVRTLQKKVSNVSQIENFKMIVSGDSLSSPYYAYNLSRFGDWSLLFPSTTTALTNVRNSMYWKKTNIDLYITHKSLNDEEEPVQYTVMIVRRKKEAGSSTQGLTDLTLNADVDYSAINGKAYMNLKKWTVVYSRRFVLGGEFYNATADTSLASGESGYKRLQISFTPKCKVVNPDGGWKNLTNPPDPTDQFYLLVFNDNSVADLESPQMDISAIHTVVH